MISWLGCKGYPEYSIRTNFNEPELSASLGFVASPYSESESTVNPSMLPTPPDLLFEALPKRIIPPQSPVALDPAGLAEVKTIGEVFVPLAINLAPRVTTKEALGVSPSALTPVITVPAPIVKVALFLTYTVPTNLYILEDDQVVFAVISPVIVTTGLAVGL